MDSGCRRSAAEPVPDPDAGPVGQPGQAEVQRRRDVVQADPRRPQRDAAARASCSQRSCGMTQTCPARNGRRCRAAGRLPADSRHVTASGGVRPASGRHRGDDGHQAPRVVVPPQRRGPGGHRAVEHRGQDALAAARAERPPAGSQPAGHARQRPAGRNASTSVWTQSRSQACPSSRASRPAACSS